jgi:hypothetical protein
MTIIPPWRYHHHHLLQELRLLPRPFRVQCACQSWRSGFFKATFETGGQRPQFRHSETRTMHAACFPGTPRAKRAHRVFASGGVSAVGLRHPFGVRACRALDCFCCRRERAACHHHTENNAHTLREIEGGWRWPAFQTSKKTEKWFRCAKQIEHCQQGSCRESCECV